MTTKITKHLPRIKINLVTVQSYYYLTIYQSRTKIYNIYKKIKLQRIFVKTGYTILVNKIRWVLIICWDVFENVYCNIQCSYPYYFSCKAFLQYSSKNICMASICIECCNLHDIIKNAAIFF